MPNWTSNFITIKGDPQDIRAFLDAVRSEDQLFDFQKIMPMPELLRKTATGRTVIGGKSVTSWYVVREASLETPEEIRAFTPEEQTALRDIGHSNWYDWSLANWGTKWNACDPRINDETIKRGYIEIIFDTAWEAPVPILRKIIVDFPKLTFECRWRNEEDFGACDADNDGRYPHYLAKDAGGDL